jgi:hypothetical protein
VSRVFRACCCGDSRVWAGASGDLLRDEHGMRRCLTSERGRDTRMPTLSVRRTHDSAEPVALAQHRDEPLAIWALRRLGRQAEATESIRGLHVTRSRFEEVRRRQPAPRA